MNNTQYIIAAARENYNDGCYSLIHAIEKAAASEDFSFTSINKAKVTVAGIARKKMTDAGKVPPKTPRGIDYNSYLIAWWERNRATTRQDILDMFKEAVAKAST